MNRRFTAAAVVAALVALGACRRDADTTYDTAAGALATPPTPYTPSAGLSVGATTGATTLVRDTLTKAKRP